MYGYSSPQEAVQQTMKQAEEAALTNVQLEHRNAYQQLKMIIQQQGTAQLNEEQRQYFNQMDQYVEAARRQAVEALCAQDPAINQYCKEMESRYQKQQLQQQQSHTGLIDFDSQDYQNQLSMYVNDICSANYQQLEFKLKTLYSSLVNKAYSRATALRHIRNVLISLQNHQLNAANPQRQQEMEQIWASIQMVHDTTGNIVSLRDSRDMGEDEEASIQINGQRFQTVPAQIPDEIIAFMVLPARAQQLINTRTRTNDTIPSQIYIKRKKGRPVKESGLSHDFYTPVFTTGQVDQEVMDFFGTESPQIAQEIDNQAKQIFDQRDFYMRPENRMSSGAMSQSGYNATQQYSQQMYQGYGMQYQNMMFSQKRPYRRHEDSYSEYDVSDHVYSESEEFIEEEITEESEEQLRLSASNDLSDSDGLEESMRQEDSSSGGELEDIEQDEENVIDEVLDIKIIPFEDSWKYPASLMVHPEPDDVWRFDELRPKAQPAIPRSDAGFILERLQYLDEDAALREAEPETKQTEQLKDQQKCYCFLIKWRGCAHVHATWELEANLTHLSSFVKVKKYKHMFIDRQTILACEKVTQAQKEMVLDQIEETRNNQQKYLIPEKIVAYRVVTDKSDAWSTQLKRVIDAARQRNGFDSDAFDGSFVRGFSDGKVHYYNQDVSAQGFDVDVDGFAAAGSPGVDSFRGELYLIKWTDLSYQACTWEHHEDLAASRHVGEEMLKQLRKAYKNAAKPIQKAIASPDCCKFGYHKQFVEFDLQRPEFLIDVNPRFRLQAHQARGVRALLYNWCRTRNMILADGKDLGKATQAICFMSALVHQYQVPGPFLVIAPVHKIPQWQEALANWFPDGIVVCLTGSKEDRRAIVEYELFQEGGAHRFHVLLTTPTGALIEEKALQKFQWRLICIDEAHQLRDRDGQRCRVFTEFQSDARLLLTSQPLMNSPLEFFNLLHFLDPDQFHTAEVFLRFGSTEHFREALKRCEIVSEDGEARLLEAPVIPMQQLQAQQGAVVVQNPMDMVISDDDDDTLMPQPAIQQVQTTQATVEDKASNILACIKPFLLRRDSAFAERGSQEVSQFVLRVNQSQLQEKYTKYILELNQTVLKYASEPSRLQNVLVQLRKVCNHPAMFQDSRMTDLTAEEIVGGSGKFEALAALLERFKAEGHRVLIYTQMLKTMTILARFCELMGYKYQQLLGSNSVEARARAIGQFNKQGSEDFVFLLSTRAGRQQINLQTATRVVIIDCDFNALQDLQAIGRISRNKTSEPVEIYRLITRDSVEESIFEISNCQQLVKPDYDVAVLRHIIETGARAVLRGSIQSKPVSQIIQEKEKVIAKADVDASRFQQFQEGFWAAQYPEVPMDEQEPSEFKGQLTREQFDKLYNCLCTYGSWRFADKAGCSGLSTQEAAQAMASIARACKQVASEFGMDVFNLSGQLQFNFQSFQQQNAVPVLRSYFKMLLIEQHITNDRCRLPKNFFEIPDFANAWGHVNDVRLLMAARLNGLCVKNYSPEMIEKLVCDAHITKQNTVEVLQARLDSICSRLQYIACPSLIEKLNEDGLHVNVQFEQANDQALDEKEAELVRRFENSGCQFPIQKDAGRTTFQIELQQKMFKTCLQQLQKFFNADRRERVKALLDRFYEFSSSRLHPEELRGISVISGLPKLKRRFDGIFSKFDTTEAEDNLLFKIYIQILNIVYSKMPIIICQCDDHILQLKLKAGSLAEIDNDALIQDYTRDLLDYLYRQVWVICGIRHFYMPYVLARMGEENALAFDEEDFEFGMDAEDYFVILRKDKGTRHEVVEHEDDDEAIGGIVDSYGE